MDDDRMSRLVYHRSRLLITVFLFSVTLSAACNVPLGELLTTYGCAKEAKRDDIFGGWVPDRATLKEIHERGKYSSAISPKIVFREDGGFELSDMPNWVWNRYDKPNPDGGLTSLTGKWSLSSPDGCAQVNLSYTGTTGSLPLLQRRIRQEPIFIIEFILGDPDSGDKMIFVRG